MSKVNTKGVMRALKNKRVKAGKAMQFGLIQGMEDFLARITDKQMTGRPGLRVRSGTLRRDWFIQKFGAGRDFGVRLASPTKYARIHQKGGTIRPKATNKRGLLMFKVNDRFVSVKSVTIPKRLHILEDYAKNGRRIIKRAMSEKVRVALG